MFTPSEIPLYSQVLAASKYIFQGFKFIGPAFEEKQNEVKNVKEEKPDPQKSSNPLENQKLLVDRRKLEKMMKSNTDGLNSAEHFFKSVMDTTATFINWHKKMKIGSRTRKHPIVNIIGRPGGVALAKGLILSKLAARGPLLKMKMVISHVDHPHLHGRAESFKSIMERTDTLIHFPDPQNTNLVAIYGTFDRLEKARLALQSTNPLLMSFELPLGMNLCERTTEYIKYIETNFSVKVIFMSIPKQGTSFAIIKGTEGGAGDMMEAVRLLAYATCSTKVDSALLNIKVEIPKNLFDLSMSAENCVCLKELKEKTQTIITIPDPKADNKDKPSPITITGSIEGIYEARRELMSQLPVELIFEIDENPMNTAEILCLQLKYEIHLNMKPNYKEKSETITMKATERRFSEIYQAKKEIMDMQTLNEDELNKVYLRALEGKSCNDLSKSEAFSRKIWSPIEVSSDGSEMEGRSSISSADWSEISSDELPEDF